MYFVEPEIYPKEGNYVEEISYRDENDFEWKIARVQNGFFLRFFGPRYFSDEYFSLDNGIKINNTRCVFFQTEGMDDFAIFMDIRNEVKTNFTDTIWSRLESLLEPRFELMPHIGLLESEVYPPLKKIK